MKKLLYTLIAVCILLIMTACTYEPVPNLPNSTTPELNAETEQGEIIQIGNSFEALMPELKSGKLIHTISRVSVITDTDDFPSMDGLSDRAYYYLNDNNEWETRNHPYFTNEDGSFTEGCYFIMLDICTRSEDAVALTINDLDSDGYPMGQYEDPYLFRSDNIVTLVSLNHPDSNDSRCWSVSSPDAEFYSRRYEHPEYEDAHATYRLEPGESIDFTLGFLIEKRLFDAWGYELNLSQIYATTALTQDAILIDLNLEGNGDA